MSEIPPPTVPPSTPPPPGGSYTPPPPGGGGYTPPPPPPGAGSDRQLMLALSYIGILAIIPLVAKKEDREIQWHAKNGLFLFIAYFVLSLVLAFVMRRVPLPCGDVVINCVIWLGYIALMVMGIMKALNGQRLRIPLISDFADK